MMVTLVMLEKLVVQVQLALEYLELEVLGLYLDLVVLAGDLEDLVLELDLQLVLEHNCCQGQPGCTGVTCVNWCKKCLFLSVT